MSHDHIGIPRFIEKGFSNKEKVFVSDVVRNKVYSTSIDRLGTKSNYYDKDVENEVLALGIEANFSNFYNDFCKFNNGTRMKKILDLNSRLVEQFFSFMYLRSQKVLEQVNQYSATSKLLGDLDHSELLRIQTFIKANPINIIGNGYYFYPLINSSKNLFIDNSIGFGIMISKEKEYSFIIPLNTQVAIVVSSKEFTNTDYFYIEPTCEYKSDRVNKCIIKTEKVLGNGFFFGKDKNTIELYTEFYKELK